MASALYGLPSLNVTKILIDPPTGIATVGDTISFSIVLENTGTTTIMTMRLTDQYDSDCLDFLWADPEQDIAAEGFIWWINLEEMAPGDRDTFDISFSAVSPCEMTFDTASVCEAHDEFGDPVPSEESVSGLQVVRSRLQVHKFLIDPPSGIARVGDTVTFQILLQNTGTSDIISIPVIDIFPQECLTFVSASPPPSQTFSGLLLWCCLGPIAAGNSETMTLNFTAASPCGFAIDTVKTQAVEDEYGFDVPDEMDDAVVKIVEPDLEISKSLLFPPLGKVEPGDSAVFQIVLHNAGTTQINSLPLIDRFAAECLSYEWAMPSPGSVFEGKLQWFNLGPLPPGARDTVLVSLLADSACGQTVDTAYVSLAVDEYGFLITDIMSTASVEIVQGELAVTKTRLEPSLEYATVDDLITFALIVENVGGTILTDLPLTDTYDDSCLQFISADPAEDSLSTGLIQWDNLGPLGIGLSDTVLVTFQALDTCGLTIDTARVQGAIDELGTFVPDQEDTASIILVEELPFPDISLSSISYYYGDVAVGESEPWNFAISNTGPVPLVVSSIVSDFADFEVTAPASFPQTINPGNFVTVTVVFTPSAEGLATGHITITSNDPDEGVLTVTVQGVGVVVEDAVQIYFPEIYYGMPGEDVTADIYMDNLTFLAEAVAGFQLSLLFDDSLLSITDVVPSTRTEDLDIFDWSIPTAGKVTIVVADVGGDTIAPGIGAIVQISFLIDSSAVEGDSVLLDFSSVIVSSPVGSALPSQSVDGYLIVGEPVVVEQVELFFPITYYALPGSEITVDIYMDNQTSLSCAVAGMQTGFTFDEDLLEITEVVPTSRTDDMGIFLWNEPEPGRIGLLVANGTGEKISPGIGSIARITFTVSDSAVEGESSPLTFTMTILSDSVSHSIANSTTNGMLIIGIGGCNSGDTDGNGTINVLDALDAVNHILGIILLDELSECRANCNADTALNVIDVLGIVNVILGINTCPPVLISGKVTPQSPASIGAHEVALSPHEDTELPVFINTQTDVAGLQFTLTCDPSKVIVGTPGLTQRTAHMTIASNFMNGSLRLVMFSQAGEFIPHGADPVVTIPIRMRDNQSLTDEGTIYFDEVILAINCAETVPVDIEPIVLKTDDSVPLRYALEQNYPNPFNPTTSIQYTVGSGQSLPRITLKIYNILGQEVRTLVDEVKEIGVYTVTWDGFDNTGTPAASGVYLYRLRVDNGLWPETRRMILMK